MTAMKQNKQENQIKAIQHLVKRKKKQLWGGGWGWGLSPKISEYNQVGRYFIFKLHCSFA